VSSSTSRLPRRKIPIQQNITRRIAGLVVVPDDFSVAKDVQSLFISLVLNPLSMKMIYPRTLGILPPHPPEIFSVVFGLLIPI
jgi:hypothetical protein